MEYMVDFEPIGRRVTLRQGGSILEAARGLEIFSGSGLAAPCGGKGRCGHCRVRLMEGPLSPPSATEAALLTAEDIAAGYRLACQATVLGPVKVEVPPATLTGRQVLQFEGEDPVVEPEPAVIHYRVDLEPTSSEHPLSLWQQVASSLRDNYRLGAVQPDLELMRGVSASAPAGMATVTLRGSALQNIYFNSPVARSLGLAVDLGTTKIAGFIVDLSTGQTLAQAGLMNPQLAYGEDVMSRLGYALEGDAPYRRMQKAVVDGLNHLLHLLTQQAGVDAAQVEEGVVAGNTAMHHILLRLPVAQLATAPYVPATPSPVVISARALGLDLAGMIYLVPCVAGFVGGDHVAMILGSRLYESVRPALGLDIGTNTEIVLAGNGRLVSCSCASGPAFEGAHIRYGMRAVDGAITGVRLSAGGSEVSFSTVGNRPPLGLCGSGVLDAVAGLYREGILNPSGRLDARHPRVATSDGPPEFLLVPAGETGCGHDLTVTQKDIAEIQLAKAAIAASTKLLLAHAGLTVEDIDEVIVAGAFGTHLQLESAVSIGMLPALPLSKFRQVGNAAGTGARLTLISLTERRRAEELARRLEYLELMAVPAFQDQFVEALSLGELA